MSFNDPQFNRIKSCIDLERMGRSHVIIVGCGGCADAIVDLVRHGVGSLTLVDPDVVGRENLGTQGYYVTDIGQLKVHALARRLRRTYPYVSVTCIPMKAQEMTDNEWIAVLDGYGPSVPSATVLAAYTDDFYAQAAMNRIVIKNRIPMIAAQIWESGLTAEIIFTYPGLTHGCARCILWDRYEAFRLGEGVHGKSAGTPINTISLLNSNCTAVTLGLLHAGSSNLRFGKMIEAMASRNFIALKCDPTCPERAFGPEQFDRPERFCWTGSAALSFPPRPDCPDCRGQGACAGPADWITNWRDIFDSAKDLHNEM